MIQRLFTLLPALTYGACVWLAFGCSSMPGVLGPALDVLDVLCETRAPLAKAQACGPDVGCKIDVIKAYLIEHGHDREVAAVLELLEAQVENSLLVRDFPGG
jgi:hypothetical protein